MTRPDFQRIEPVETLTLPRAKPGWRGVPVAEIRLGRLDGLWLYSASAMRFDGSSSYFGEPLGVWSDRQPRAFSSRTEAIASAAARINRHFAPSPPAAVAAWLSGLDGPAQLDLFGAAA